MRRYGYGYNPELMTIMNPGPRSRSRRRGSNPPLKKKIGRGWYTFQELVDKNLSKMVKGKKFRSGKSYFAARKRARDKARREFKKGYVFHRGMKLKIVGWVGGKGRRK
jgi:hypothetical protein